MVRIVIFRIMDIVGPLRTEAWSGLSTGVPVVGFPDGGPVKTDFLPKNNIGNVAALDAGENAVAFFRVTI